jgi:tetratricopeptide (TPR) repeat protein
MLKRLKTLFGSNRHADAPADEPSTPITVFDEYGRTLTISREDWRENVLRPHLQKMWNDPDALYQQILSAVNDGFAVEVVGAAGHLLDIDTLPERAHVMHGIVLLKVRQLDAARATLEAGMAKVGRTGVLLTNLAKVEFAQGKETRALDTLWQAVRADPNLDNGMTWWVAVQRDRGGEPAYLEALRTLAALPGSWRASLWLARDHLDRGDTDAAMDLYQGILARFPLDGNAITMISGDLGKHGQAAIVPDLIAPVYDPTRHGMHAGLNLLCALHETRRIDEGEALLDRLYALDQPPFRQDLDGYADAFRQLRSNDYRSHEVDPSQLQLRLMSLDQPVWHYGLHQPDWLFAQKPATASKVGFSALTITAANAGTATEGQEDDSGRLTRAIALYLAEAVHYWTGFQSVVHVAAVEGRGPVVFGAPDDASVCERASGDMPWYVTGELAVPAQPDGDYALTLRLWDCARRETAAVETASCPRAGIGAAVLALEERLLEHLDRSLPGALDAFYQRPPAGLMEPYLSYLGQSFMLSMIANGVGSKDTLCGERAILGWPLTMALHWPQAEVPKLMYLSGLGKAAEYGSAVLSEYRQRSLALLRQAVPDSPAAQLAPAAWKALGMHDDPTIQSSAVASHDAPAYLAWLGRLGG